MLSIGIPNKVFKIVKWLLNGTGCIMKKEDKRVFEQETKTLSGVRQTMKRSPTEMEGVGPEMG